MSFSTAGAFQLPSSDRPAKVAIPRLHTEPRHEPPPKSLAARKPRVSIACRSCRTRKVRCNGGKPMCSKCAGSSEPCVYDERRRDRLKIATNQVEEMEALLQDIRVRATNDDREKIDRVLEQVCCHFRCHPHSVQHNLTRVRHWMEM
ncbi:hypothetical protein DM02DRAFT_603875 [Periconia macrospinosa]|uniref:Zn(2)-C6 fungal-type domain-containing protein n=1 Tax=Periconia macrospinosa TaxID=97972 RepID=A0A2V1D669_9PLEO|nr:hypothetical protein DM02DRAFT_603875 [Periconia macrospinosa]